jgi:7-keto-8-aminopelargonate synthetase-like enzyme
LEEILKWADKTRNAERGTQKQQRNTLVVTESIFSMDGDHAPLEKIVALKEKHGAWLMVDEAHATGLYGKNRRGLAEELGVSERIEIQMGTLGKALGASGGYICGSRALIDFLINRARSFIFSTAPVPAAVAAAFAGIEVVRSDEGQARCQWLWRRVEELMLKLKMQSPKAPSAIMPVILGEEAKAVAAAAQLRESGIFVAAIRYPTVARGAARLRVTLTAAHTSEDIAELAPALDATRNTQHAPP